MLTVTTIDIEDINQGTIVLTALTASEVADLTSRRMSGTAYDANEWEARSRVISVTEGTENGWPVLTVEGAFLGDDAPSTWVRSYARSEGARLLTITN